MMSSERLQANLKGFNMKSAVIDTGTKTCDAIRLPDGSMQVVSGSSLGLEALLAESAANATAPSHTPAQTETGNSIAIPD